MTAKSEIATHGSSVFEAGGPMGGRRMGGWRKVAQLDSPGAAGGRLAVVRWSTGGRLAIGRLATRRQPAEGWLTGSVEHYIYIYMYIHISIYT